MKASSRLSPTLPTRPENSNNLFGMKYLTGNPFRMKGVAQIPVCNPNKPSHLAPGNR